MNERREQRQTVVDAEVVNTGSDYGRGSGQTRYTYFSMMGPASPGHQGREYAGIITLFLFFYCLMQWGFLAALGFAFFYVTGSAVGLYWMLRSLLAGRVPNPWLWRTGTWLASMLLVSRLV